MVWSVSAIDNDFSQQALTQIQQATRVQPTRVAAGEPAPSMGPSVVVAQRVEQMASTMATGPVAAVTQAARASNQAISLTQTADAGLRAVDTQLTRMRELATQADGAAENAPQRIAVDTAYQAAARQLQTVVSHTAYGGTALLDGSTRARTFDQLEIMLPDVSAACECLMGTRLNCQWATSRALMAIDEAIANVGLLRTQLSGAIVTLRDTNIRSLTQQLNLSGADPYTVDNAYAIATNALASVRAQEQAAHVVAVVANQMPAAALALLYFDGAASGGR